ncbi:RNA polymerase sigma factor [Microbacterium halophytorum]|uniref:hypothetical protein n=1 Tax=Microbacterium halophytorum TaxID=2067568 RepID=UPI00131A42A9|nr:hypothetical protein [Microbacterium halophytorum]
MRRNDIPVVVNGADSDLVDQTKHGLAGAFEELRRRHYPAMHEAAASLTTSRPTAADRLVEKAFVDVRTRISADQTNAPFRLLALHAMSQEAAIDIPRRLTETDAAMTMRSVVALTRVRRRGQLALWHLDVERLRPHDAAAFLGAPTHRVGQMGFAARLELGEAVLRSEGRVMRTCHHRNPIAHVLGTGNAPSDSESERAAAIEADACPRCDMRLDRADRTIVEIRESVVPALLGRAGADQYLSARLAAPALRTTPVRTTLSARALTALKSRSIGRFERTPVRALGAVAALATAGVVALGVNTIGFSGAELDADSTKADRPCDVRRSLCVDDLRTEVVTIPEYTTGSPTGTDRTSQPRPLPLVPTPDGRSDATPGIGQAPGTVSSQHPSGTATRSAGSSSASDSSSSSSESSASSAGDSTPSPDGSPASADTKELSADNSSAPSPSPTPSEPATDDTDSSAAPADDPQEVAAPLSLQPGTKTFVNGRWEFRGVVVGEPDSTVLFFVDGSPLRSAAIGANGRGEFTVTATYDQLRRTAPVRAQYARSNTGGQDQSHATSALSVIDLLQRSSFVE